MHDPRMDPRNVRRLHARRRLRRQRFAAAFGTIVAAIAVGAALSGIGLTIPGHAALVRGEPGDGKPNPSASQTFDIVASGDLLIHGPVWERAKAVGHDRYDFRPTAPREEQWTIVG